MAYSYSPLRYPGGKSRLANFIQLTLKLNEIEQGTYVEPFAGGAGVAMCLLLKNKVSRIMINDLDDAVYAFWYSVLHHTDELCGVIQKTPVDMETWHKQKYIFNQKDKKELLELGFATFFLNRTNRSGILTGGVIGGLQQTGKWKIGARYPKDKLINSIQSIAEKKDQITLTNLDARDFIHQHTGDLAQDTLIYLDPPYYHKGQKLYHNALNSDDHCLIAHTVQNELNFRWIVSYDDTEEINRLYSKKRKESHSLNYTAANRYQGKEIIIYSDNLQVPRVDNPFRITRNQFVKHYQTLSVDR